MAWYWWCVIVGVVGWACYIAGLFVCASREWDDYSASYWRARWSERGQQIEALNKKLAVKKQIINALKDSIRQKVKP